jgi:D-Tyr-tRNAtyr deacylase
MRAVVQRVSRARVSVNDRTNNDRANNDWTSGEIGLGLLVLLAVGHGDTEADAT